MNKDHVTELLLQSLEHEHGGTQVYETALECAVNSELAEEWQKYLEQTRKHEQVLRQTCEALGIDTEAMSPGREIIRDMGQSLVAAMQKALKAGDRDAAQLVACECVVLAETKDHLDWELIGRVAGSAKGEMKKALEAAYDEVEDEEDEHLYHSKGWCRELWIQALGMRAVLPPPEEEKHVKTAIGAARAEQQRKQMM